MLIDGALACYLTRGGKHIQVFLPDDEPDRSHVAAALAAKLRSLASAPERGGLSIGEINGEAADRHPLAAELRDVGFLPSQKGFYLPRTAREQVLPLGAANEEEPDEPEARDA